ncbi:MAG: thiol:disulfide interchange protein DsbA/DsbL [Rhodanobacteraceae bacterium]
MPKTMSVLLAGLALVIAGTAQAADASKWVEGKNYQLVSPTVATHSGNKVEVVEVFSYACPHCAHFQPYAEKIKSELPAGAVYSYRPAVFYKQWEPYARGYLAAKAMGVADKGHQALFDALHRDRKPIRTLEDLGKFYAQYGVDPGEFVSTAESFVIGNQLQQDVAWERQAGVAGTPTIIIDGKYRIEPDKAGGSEQMVELTEYLVRKELAARNTDSK